MPKKIYKVVDVLDGCPTFEVPISEILSQLKRGGALKILDPLEYHTDRQRKWYKGVCLRQLAANDPNGEPESWWDTEVKRHCDGLGLLKKEIFFVEDALGNRLGVGRLTIKDVGKRNMTQFIENILSVAIERGWPVSPPDENLRANTLKKRKPPDGF